jgi:hypothetical protein
LELVLESCDFPIPPFISSNFFQFIYNFKNKFLTYELSPNLFPQSTKIL